MPNSAIPAWAHPLCLALLPRGKLLWRVDGGLAQRLAAQRWEMCGDAAHAEFPKQLSAVGILSVLLRGWGFRSLIRCGVDGSTFVYRLRTW